MSQEHFDLSRSHAARALADRFTLPAAAPGVVTWCADSRTRTRTRPTITHVPEATPQSSPADRRRLGRPADHRDDLGADTDTQTNLHSFSKIASKRAIEAIPKVDTPLAHRGPHSRHLTPRLSCGARAPQPLRHRPPARRQLQPVVRWPKLSSFPQSLSKPAPARSD